MQKRRGNKHGYEKQKYKVYLYLIISRSYISFSFLQLRSLIFGVD